VTEILSQDEIDTLLNAMSTGDISTDTIKETKVQKKVIIYDFM
jgi:flagellar motor switch protein FliM